MVDWISINMEVSQNTGTPKSSILDHVTGIFPYNASILGYPPFVGETPKSIVINNLVGFSAINTMKDWNTHMFFMVQKRSLQSQCFYRVNWATSSAAPRPSSSIAFDIRRSCSTGVPWLRCGGFLKWRYPNSWMVYEGSSQSKMDDLGVPPFYEAHRCWWWFSDLDTVEPSIKIGLQQKNVLDTRHWQISK